MKRQQAVQRHAVSVRGAGPGTLLFANGFGCDQRIWRHVAPAFEHDHRVICYDHLGSGGSDPAAYDPLRHDRLQGHADDLLALCEALDLQQVDVVAHSVGCMIALLAAVAQPQRFRRLVFVAPSPCYIDEPPHYEGGFSRADILELLDLMARNALGWASFLAGVVMGHPERPELAEELRTSFCHLDPQVAHQFGRATFLSDHRSDLRRLGLPTLVLQCTQDLVAPLSVGDYLCRHLPAATLVRLAVAGHCPQLSDPVQTIEAISGYLGTAPARMTLS